MNDLLIGFWFETERGYGIGVTSYSLADAKTLCEKEGLLPQRGLSDVIQNVDLQSLDQNHVLPNVGLPNVRGIWFPNLNCK